MIVINHFFIKDSFNKKIFKSLIIYYLKILKRIIIIDNWGYKGSLGAMDSALDF